ncbi:glutaminase liver isoform, mitochondrial-like [Liolophura sinensis]|uniref:glutaminase liver isoform, mitochondrial-like n=1 Tax=Liolophura sinensis TaxID=3198878 RepID=UPI0031590FCF
MAGLSYRGICCGGSMAWWVANHFARRAYGSVPAACHRELIRPCWPARRHFIGRNRSRSALWARSCTYQHRPELFQSVSPENIVLDAKNSPSVQEAPRPPHFEDVLFNLLCDKTQRLSVNRFKAALKATGLREEDPRLKETIGNFSHLQAKVADFDGLDGINIDKETFRECVTDNIVLLAKAFQNRLIIPEFTAFSKRIENLYWRAKTNNNGMVASYIPQLARFSPDLWGVSVCTVDGQRFSVGDVNIPFCLQSMSKPLTYALVLDDLGSEVVHDYVGHEPSGTAFNEISLNFAKKPHNPMINSGAIVVCSLMGQGMSIADRFDSTASKLKRFTGGEYVGFSNATFLSERESADRNYALGYYLRENQCFPHGTNLMETMDFYFQLCSVEVTCDSASLMAGTLANGGICPITGERVVISESVRNTLSLMHSCGMYDYSGQFAFTVGLPAKSGVSGGILLVVPNVMGVCLWSPPLDSWGNSCRGRQLCEDLVSIFNFHNYDNLKHTAKKLDPRKRRDDSKAQDIVNLLFGAYNGDVTALTRYALQGMDMSQADYDGRTALHLSAAEGHLPVVNFLINRCKVSPFVKDRWGFTPIDDAKRFDHEEVVQTLQDYISSFEDFQPDSGDSPLSLGDFPKDSSGDSPHDSASDGLSVEEGKQEGHSEQDAQDK